ncbi:hypothetical protein CkaCkLH20_10919 [Colletotrichum karsti]|uniref:Fungal N-terminal domain-containing protein n=1 Tax=Colletotrichum karsti TaxID=1095194 RepID=A0A9P6HYZ7_9PEZI|nr:uncharacterized protein CkaCkLH20_10919 [Colletotrichum karsti]KAF9871721.1 hypothetical protein CkaCkLH20_10919 [Colletotrichum karsti]
MESIAALGLACNIFQVISVGHETIRLVKDIYNKGSIESPLAEYSVSLRDISSHISTFELPQKAPQYQKQLKENAAKCYAVARDLAEEISFLLAEKAKGDLLKTLKTVAKTTWRKRRLERFERQLKDLEKQMQSGLLTRLVDNSNAIQLRQEALDGRIRHLLQQYQDGKTQASELILKDGATTRAHVLRESSKLQRQVDSATQASAAQVMSLMSNLDLKRVDSARLDQFVESLAFHGMNERRNQATDSHEGTSKWIFFQCGETFSEEDDSDINVDDEDLSHDSQRWDNFGDWLRSGEQPPNIPPVPLRLNNPLQRPIIKRNPPPKQHPQDLRPLRPPNNLLIVNSLTDLLPERGPELPGLGVILKPPRPVDVFPENLFETVHADSEGRAVICRWSDHDVIRHEVPVSNDPRQPFNIPHLSHNPPRHAPELPLESFTHDPQPPTQTPTDLSPDDVLDIPPPPPRIRKHSREIPHNPPPRLPRTPPERTQRHTTNPLHQIPNQHPLRPATNRLQPLEHPQFPNPRNDALPEYPSRLLTHPDIDPVPSRPELDQPATTPVTSTDLAPGIPPVQRPEEQSIRTEPLERRRDDVPPRHPLPRELMHARDDGGAQAASREERGYLLRLPGLQTRRGAAVVVGGAVVVAGSSHDARRFQRDIVSQRSVLVQR